MEFGSHLNRRNIEGTLKIVMPAAAMAVILTGIKRVSADDDSNKQAASILHAAINNVAAQGVSGAYNAVTTCVSFADTANRVNPIDSIFKTNYNWVILTECSRNMTAAVQKLGIDGQNLEAVSKAIWNSPNDVFHELTYDMGQVNSDLLNSMGQMLYGLYHNVPLLLTKGIMLLMH